jgi:hypothetical protein
MYVLIDVKIRNQILKVGFYLLLDYNKETARSHSDPPAGG